MAIEPISSVMSYQIQSTQTTKNVTKPEAVNTEVTAQQNTVDFDPATAKIVESQESDTKGQSKEDDTDSLLKDNIEKVRAENKKIRTAVEELNKKMHNSEAVYGIHEGTNRVTIRLIDKDTKETIKELPAEKTLDMIARVWEMAGILVDEKR